MSAQGSPVTAHDRATDAAPPASGRPILEFEAPPAILALVHDAACRLGATPEQALEAARTGLLTMSALDIGLACNLDEDTVIAVAGLGAEYLADPARSRDALGATADLLMHFGAVLARGPHEAQLMGRWRVFGRSPAAFAQWLSDFAGLGAALRAQAAHTH